MSATDTPAEGRIAAIQATWHSELVDRAREAFVADLVAEGTDRDRIDVLQVPGAFEIPLHALRLAESGRYAAIACFALVVDGGIYRHDFVASTVLDGLMRVQLDTRVPVFSVVLTPHHFHEHADHEGFFAEHLVGKGAEAARALRATVASLDALPA
jgi:6,7-dimethyl-8-ribityllumazine synthase